jgi:hypothetical protein
VVNFVGDGRGVDDGTHRVIKTDSQNRLQAHAL